MAAPTDSRTSEVKTSHLSSALLTWLESPDPERGLHWWDGMKWRWCSYPEIADRVHGVSRQLVAAGVRPGDPVAVPDDHSPWFASAFFGALHAGATVIPLPPPAAGANRFADEGARMIAAASARFVVSRDPTTHDRVNKVAAVAGATVVDIDERRDSALPAADAAEPAVLQFTSGSSRSPRAVRIGIENIEAHVRLLRSWLDLRPADQGVSWLPFHHDMGLVGSLLMPVLSQLTMWHMRPKHFLVDPLVWLRCIGEGPATFTGAPGFAYSYVARRVDAAQVASLDFSRWRSAVVGAERLDAAGLRAFVELLGPSGFRPEAVLPAYGLAEATLAVSGSALDRSPSVARVRPGPLTQDMRVPVLGTGTLADVRADGAQLIVGSGAPLPGVEVRIVGQDGDLPDGWLGEVVVRSPGVANGYLGHGPDAGTRFKGGRLFTGDAGFAHDGELYVLGRIAESLSVRGQTVHAEDVEAAVAAALYLPNLTCTAALLHRADADLLAVVIEQPDDGEPTEDWPRRVTTAVRSYVGPGVEVAVHIAAPGAVPRTTSGKPQRRRLARLISSGAFDAEPE